MICDNSFSSKDSLYSMIRVLSKQKPGLKIAHLNAQSLNNKMDEFRQLFTTSGLDIICVSETWFHFSVSDGIYQLPGFNLFRADRETNAGGVCIYIKNGLKCNVKLTSDNTSQIEFLFLEMITEDKNKILIGAVYRPNRRIQIDSLMASIADISVEYNDIIIAGDFNSNLLENNTLVDSTFILGLYPVNTTIPTHFSYLTNSLLDAFFVNQKNKVLLYDQLSAPAFSKHDLIFLTYDTFVSKENTRITFRDFRNTNYNLLSEMVENTQWDSIFTFESVDDQISFFDEHITHLFNTCVPLRSKRIIHEQPPWFNADIKRLISKRDLLHKRWKRFKTSSLHDMFKLARSEVTKEIRAAKSSYYQQKFASAAGSKSKWTVIKSIGIGQKTSNVVADVNADLLNKQFIGDNSDVNSTDICTNFYSSYCNVSVENRFTFRCVNHIEILNGVRSIKSNAIGLDELNPKFLKLLLPNILPYLAHIFNTILTKSTFPTAWKYTKIIPIPKSTKDFRPIAILPYLSKVLESMMYVQINDYLHKNCLLSDRQSGFRSKRSCVTALLDVTEDLRARMDDNMVSFLVLLDHSKAFDNVSHPILLTKLDKLYNFSKSACMLIKSYLADRSQIVCCNNVTSHALTNFKGVPQGSILGPLLFCIYVNDLPEVLRYSKMHLYADDVQIYLSANVDDISSCICKINHDLERVGNWASNNRLCINPSKSKCIVISKRKTPVHESYSISINNSMIYIAQTSSNLGVTFNENLTWTNHINISVGRVYGMLRNLWAVQTSTPVHIRMLLAKSYLIPVLLYGCEIFANCNRMDMDRLNVAFNSIARYVFNRKRFDSISTYAYQIFGMCFENYLKYRCLLQLHKIVYTKEPPYLYDRIRFARSGRGKMLIQQRYRYSRSEGQFFIPTVRLWNSLPVAIQTKSNALHFKKELMHFFG